MRNRRSSTEVTRVQTTLATRTFAALEREAKVRRLSLSQIAAEAIERGLRRSLPADADDRLLILERRLSDHMRLNARDLQIVEELQFAIARTLFTRLPETAHDRDPVLQAAVEARLARLLDEVASRISAGPPPSRTLTEPATALPSQAPG